MSTRSALAPTLSVTVVRGRVNLKAFCRRFPTTAARTCRSASIATPSSTGITVSSDATGVRVQRRGRREFFDEPGHQELLPILNALRETDLGERTSNEIACDAMRLRWSTVPVLPADADVSRLQNLERHDRRVDQVAQFMSEEPEAFAPARGLSIDAGLIALAPVLGDRAGDGVVEASVQRAKVVGADRRVHVPPPAR